MGLLKLAFHLFMQSFIEDKKDSKIQNRNKIILFNHLIISA